MKTVVVFGSGRVARPAIKTLLSSGHAVVVATDQPDSGEKLIEGHPHANILEIDAADSDAVREAVARGELSVSLLPVAFHTRVARACVEQGRPFITTSYVSDEMRSLHEDACRAGILLLNEIGADPGIDHMQAMQLIHRIQAEGGRVTGIRSLCGGIPAPEANDNPLGYKLSWSTRGVVLAGLRSARYLENQKLVGLGPFEIFHHPRPVSLDGLGDLESYPNGDSVRFEKEYGLSRLDTILRGSLRWRGWCETWTALSRLGLVDETPQDALPGSTFAQEMRRAIGAGAGDELRAAVAGTLALPSDHRILASLEWLGLFADCPVPETARSRADLLVHCMDETLQYRPGERDMVVLHHEIEFVDSAGSSRVARSSTQEYGRPDGDSAMARTVGLPAAFAAARILDGTIAVRGVQIPVDPQIYDSVLQDLAKVGIQDVVKQA